MTWKIRSDKRVFGVFHKNGFGIFLKRHIYPLPPRAFLHTNECCHQSTHTLYSRWIRPRVSTVYLCLNTRQEPRLLTPLSSIHFVTFSCRVYGHSLGSMQNNATSLDWIVSVKGARREFTAELKEKCDALEPKAQAQLQPVLTCSATGSKNNRTQPAIHRSAGPDHDPIRCTWRPRTLYEIQTGESLNCVYL